MSFSIKKRNDDVFEVTVANCPTTTHTVTITDQSLSDLTYENLTKAQLLEFLSGFFWREKQIHLSCRHLISTEFLNTSQTAEMHSDDGVMRVKQKTIISVMTQSRSFTGFDTKISGNKKLQVGPNR